MNYKDKRWLRKRAVILRRDKHQCRECRRYGRPRAATTVHHIMPVEIYPEYWLVNDNLLGLCGQCHDSMHDRVNNTLTAKGLEWFERMKDVIQSQASLQKL